MKYALVNGVREEAATSGARGLCEECTNPVVAHCGTQRVWHWKHYRKSPLCWAKEVTQWHRAWQDAFPPSWQEFAQKDQNGEIHRADIRTSSGVVLEFQYSKITQVEREQREDFYKDMAWVVNGTRLKGDYSRFYNNLKLLKKFNNVDLFSTDSPEKLFNRDWLNSRAPVYFDFERDKNNNIVDPQDKIRSFLCCLLPGRIRGQAVILRVGRKAFSLWSQKNSHLAYTEHTLKQVALAMKYGVPLVSRAN